MANMNELMRQAARVQRQLARIQEEMKLREWTGKVAGDRVAATVNGEHKVLRITVDADFYKAEEMDVVLDSICAAINAASADAEKAMEAAVKEATPPGFKIPGLGG